MESARFCFLRKKEAGTRIMETARVAEWEKRNNCNGESGASTLMLMKQTGPISIDSV
jgi:hypothetical protein